MLKEKGTIYVIAMIARYIGRGAILSYFYTFTANSTEGRDFLP